MFGEIGMEFWRELLQQPLHPWRGNASRLSHTGLDSATLTTLCSFIGGVSFPGVLAPAVRWLRTEGYTAFSSFTHPLTLPR